MKYSVRWLRSRLSIRLRLTLAFALAMAIVLAATGAFLYLRLESELDSSLNDSLRSRADEISALVIEGGTGLRESGGQRLAELDEAFAQVLASDGQILDTSPQLGDLVLLSETERSRASQGTMFIEKEALSELLDAPSRLLATPIELDGGEVIVIVGASLEDRDDALSGLLTQLLIIGPIALLVASGLGYLLAAAALRPVEAMRQEAAAVSAYEPGRRLPVPPQRDEISRLGETLNAMLGRLESALSRERRFVAEASHELRTPLASLKAELELGLRRARSPDELESALQSAAEETDRLIRLAEDLLVLARSDQGQLPVRRAEINAAELLMLVATRFSHVSAGNGGAVETEAPPDLTLQGDSLRLEQALGNLVDNAMRHGAGTVRLTAARNGHGVEFHVTDEGSGFPPDFLDEAFDRFARPDESRGRSGTGLGLAIVQVIAQAHGGTAHVENRSSGGAHAWIVIPDRSGASSQ